jgi:hypothetical protein
VAPLVKLRFISIAKVQPVTFSGFGNGVLLERRMFPKITVQNGGG